MKKILYVVSTALIGGVEKLVERLGRDLSHRYKIDVAVIGSNGSLLSNYNKIFNHVWDIWAHKCAGRINLRDIPNMLPLANYEIIHIFNHFALSKILAERNVSKMVQSIHFHPDAMKTEYREMLIENQNLFKAIIVDSKLHSYLTHYVYIPNFVDTDFWLPKDWNQNRIIWVGKFNDVKNYKLLMKITDITNREFIIVDGLSWLPTSKEYKKIIKRKYGNRVKIYTEVDENVLRNLYQESSHMLITSKYEGTPLSLLEAMSCGVIPVSTPVGNIPNIIKHGNNGFIYNSCDEAINYLSYYSDKMKRRAREEMVKNFSQEEITSKYFEVYEK